MNYLKKIITNDGSFSLRSKKYNEDFHSSKGALYESNIKFILPSKLERFKDKSLKVLDICFGLGYNSAQLFNNLIKQTTYLKWYSLEIDKKPLKYSLEDKSFIDLWDPKVIKIFNSLYIHNEFRDVFFDCKLLWGDARQEIIKIPGNIYFDLIFLDGFSPQNCPEIWSIEFLTKLNQKLSSSGYLITYSSSAAVRKTLINIGLEIFKIKPSELDSNLWSNGTLATYPTNINDLKENLFVDNLSDMEKEHLETKASIPYRDPEGKSLSKEILEKRFKEQLFSELIETNLWRKKWKMAKSIPKG